MNACLTKNAIEIAVRLSAVLLLCGCGSSTHDVDPELARKTLEATLNRWKSGESVETASQAVPEVVIQDREWSAGYRLVDFQIHERPKPVDANLKAVVDLELEDPTGNPVSRTVTYLVTTDPRLTVFRDAFQ